MLLCTVLVRVPLGPFTAPATLAAGPAIAGGIAVAIMAGIVVALIVNANKKVKAEYKLN